MFYVYAYLRENGTPYYIGKGKNCRAWSKDHSVNLPKNKNRIGLSNKGKSKIAGNKNPKFGKGYLITGSNNPNSKKWELIDKKTKTKTFIDNLVQYCKINNLNYQTVYCWQYQKIDNVPRLQKV